MLLLFSPLSPCSATCRVETKAASWGRGSVTYGAVAAHPKEGRQTGRKTLELIVPGIFSGVI